MIRSGTMLAGRYRVVRHLGSGGMATVHLADDEVLRRRVAVKSVLAEPGSERGRRIRREARLGAGLRHPHLVTVYDVLTEDEQVLLVMEYVDGETLAEVVRRGPLPPDRALALLRPLAEALDHAHEHGVVHRDVKPANVLVTGDGTVKLSDLGIATSAEVTQITRTGGTLGTAAYMAPEQFEPGPVTRAADVYALAAVAFEVLAGRRAFDEVTPAKLFARLHEGTPPPDLRSARPDLPEAAAAAIARGMAPRPSDRPAGAGAFVEALAEALEGTPGATAATAGPATARAPVTGTAGAARTATIAERSPASVRGSRRPPARLLAPLAAVALLGAVAAVVISSVGGGEQPEGGASDPPAQDARPTDRTGTRATTAASAPSPSDSPEGAVRAFYERAADGDLAGSWRIAGPGMRAAFGGSRSRLEATLGTLTSIRFRRLEAADRTQTTATVRISTVATHTDRTDRCTGTVRAVRDAGRGWLAGEPRVQCA